MFEGCHVIVRCTQAAAHFGILVHEEDNTVVLKDARRIWSWAGAATLTDLALDGSRRPTECKVTRPAPLVKLGDACEVIMCTKEAVAAFNEIPEWTEG
jgi:hypothetical protein